MPLRIDNRKIIISAYRPPQYFHEFPLVCVLLLFSCFQIVHRRLFRADAAILLACGGLFLTLRERVATCVYNAVTPNYVFSFFLGTVQLFHEERNTLVGGHTITLSIVWESGADFPAPAGLLTHLVSLDTLDGIKRAYGHEYGLTLEGALLRIALIHKVIANAAGVLTLLVSGEQALGHEVRTGETLALMRFQKCLHTLHRGGGGFLRGGRLFVNILAVQQVNLMRSPLPHFISGHTGRQGHNVHVGQDSVEKVAVKILGSHSINSFLRL
nr:MAG TPA: hypothetical protein [Caudoviricetes sp.]